MTVRVQFVGSGDSFGSGGRFQTCIPVEAPGIRFAIDFGTSSLIALNQLSHVHEIPEECAEDGMVVEL